MTLKLKKRFQFGLDFSHFADLNHQAKIQKISVAKLLRIIINNYLNR
jgi:hypothetical protein